MHYSKEIHIASLAVQRAALLTQKVFHERAKGTLSKSDKSPVTKGDFGAQALIIKAIKHNFPSDAIVAEEEAASLRADPPLADEIFSLVKDISLSSPDCDALLGGPIATKDELLNAIDAGNSPGGNQGRIWALDPIDGTKGFLRGGQYAICLALIVNGDVQVGVIGCPNLPHDDSAPIPTDLASMDDAADYGVLFSAIKGEGAYDAPLTTGGLAAQKQIAMRPVPAIAEATFCEGVEAGHSDQSGNQAVASALGISAAPVRLDSQAKYCSIARGAGDIYLRLPLTMEYQEKTTRKDLCLLQAVDVLWWSI
ncbi:putative actin patch assembly and actin polymerization protein [Ascosphaera pollenicola]|nr:putative actin patch assembly and actin polymerization protein [Ascosphaera pollenicola]